MRNTQIQTFEQALPRTIAPIGAAYTAIKTLEVSLVIAAFSMSNPNASTSYVFAQAAIISILGVTAGAIAGYLGSYGCSNLLMQAFPILKNTESRFLLQPGLLSQVGLFGAATAIMSVSDSANKIWCGL